MVYLHIAAVTVIFIAAMTGIWLFTKWGVYTYGTLFGFGVGTFFIVVSVVIDRLRQRGRRADGPK